MKSISGSGLSKNTGYALTILVSLLLILLTLWVINDPALMADASVGKIIPSADTVMDIAGSALRLVKPGAWYYSM